MLDGDADVGGTDRVEGRREVHGVEIGTHRHDGDQRLRCHCCRRTHLRAHTGLGCRRYTYRSGADIENHGPTSRWTRPVAAASTSP